MTPGRGFRWVRVGEKLRDADTHYSVGAWHLTIAGGLPCLYANRYRRRTATRKTKGRA